MSEEHSILPLPATAAEELRALYVDYIHGTEQYFSGNSFRRTLQSLVSGGGRYAVCPLHEEFLGRLAAFVAACAAQAELAPESWGFASGEMLDFMLCADKPSDDHPAGFVLLAAEATAFPLLLYVPAGRRREIADRYAAKLKRKPPLPNQKKLLRALREGT